MRTFQILQQVFVADHQTFVRGLFREFLNRNPAPEDLAYFIHCLKSGRRSKNEILKIVIMSIEFAELVQNGSLQSSMLFFQKSMQADAETFVTEIYREFHGRDPDLGGFQHFVDLLKMGKSKVDILRTVLLSEEAMKRFHAWSHEDRKYPGVSRDYSAIWPQVSIDRIFRENIKKILDDHNLPFATNIIVKGGGIGDFVQITPVAKALKMKEPERPVVAVINHSGSLYDEHPYIDLAIEYGGISDREAVRSLVGLVENVFNLQYVSSAYGTWQNTDQYHDNYDCDPHSALRINELKMHVCDIMLYSLGLKQYADCNDVCINPDMMIEKIPRDYVVVSGIPGGDTLGRLKRWSAEGWDGLIKWMHLQEIIPVQLGLAADSLLHPEVMDLRGKTTPRQAAGYLKLSKGYVGIEGGLFHLAKAVGVPAVVIFNTTTETCFAYPDTYVVTKKVCRPCWLNDPWYQGKCLKGRKTCLNLPCWESVAAKVSKMLNRSDG